MQTRIYRFEIVRALVNGVYEALDTENNSAITLYEWTPAIADRAGAKLRLSEIQDQLHGAVFTADASLYLIAASPEAAQEPLRTLHSRSLFTGVEPSGPQPSSPLPPPPAPRPEAATGDPKIVVTKEDLKPPPPAPIKAKSSGNAWGWIVAAVICAIIAFAIGSSYGDSRARGSLHYLEYDARSLREQLDSLNNTVHLLRLENGTSSGVQVAVMYKNWAGVWVLSGWQGLAPHTTAVLASSPAEDFYYTAYDPSDGAVWSGKNYKDAYPVPRGAFVYYPFSGLRPSASPVKLYHVIGNFSRLTRK